MNRENIIAMLQGLLIGAAIAGVLLTALHVKP